MAFASAPRSLSRYSAYHEGVCAMTRGSQYLLFILCMFPARVVPMQSGTSAARCRTASSMPHRAGFLEAPFAAQAGAGRTLDP